VLGLLPANSLVEASVLNGDGHLGGEGGQDALVVFMEKGRAGVVRGPGRNDAAFVKEGYNQLGAGLGIRGDVALVLAHIGDIDRAPLADGRADQSASDGNAAHGRGKSRKRQGVARVMSLSSRRGEGAGAASPPRDGQVVVA